MLKFLNGHALLVGVGRYKDDTLSVPITAQDAEDLGQVLIKSQFCGYPEDQVVVLTNQNANQTRILDELDAMKKRVEADKNPTVVIFFSGHGWDEDGYFFLPYETETQVSGGKLLMNSDTALSNEVFLDKVRQIPAQRLVILFNTCFAGGLGTALSPKINQLSQLAPVPLGLYDSLLQGSGRVIISSSRASEHSWIKGGAQNSIFVAHLLSGLRGEGIQSSQDTIRILDLFSHLSAIVSTDAETIGVTQTPVLKAYDVTQNFPIALLLGGEGLSPETVKMPPTKAIYHTATIRRLLIEALTDEELEFLCFDYFPKVHEQFSTGMSKSQKTQRLIEYCARHDQFPHLFDLIREINPWKFTDYEELLTG